MSVLDTSMDLIVRYGFKVLGALVVLAGGLLVSRWIGNLVYRWAGRRELDLEPPVQILIVRVVKILVLAFTLLIVLDQLGVQITPLIAGIGVAGIGISFALQGVLSNVMAGLTIIFTKPYRLGEYIDIVGEQGHVTAIDIFSTTLSHLDRSRIVIPNRKIVGEILHNFGSLRQAHLRVGVSYKTNLNEALAVIHELLAHNPRVLKDPPPGVGIAALGDSAITISIDPWTSVTDYGVAQAELHRAILEGFRAKGIEMAVPQHEVRLLSAP